MKKRKGKIVLALLLGVLMLGIGYAAISNITLTITGTAAATPGADAFKVEFTSVETYAYNGTTELSSTTEGYTDFATTASYSETTGTFSVSGLHKKGDTVEFTYTVTNESDDLSANLSIPTISAYNNSDYITISVDPVDEVTVAASGAQDYIVTVQLTKTPLVDISTGDVTISFEASPVESSTVSG